MKYFQKLFYCCRLPHFFVTIYCSWFDDIPSKLVTNRKNRIPELRFFQVFAYAEDTKIKNFKNPLTYSINNSSNIFHVIATSAHNMHLNAEFLTFFKIA